MVGLSVAVPAAARAQASAPAEETTERFAGVARSEDGKVAYREQHHWNP